MLISRFPSNGGQKINNSTPIEVTAANQIKIGDTVYTVEHDPILKGSLVSHHLSDRVSTSAFSPDGSTLVLGGSFTGRATAYSVSGSIITYVSDIYADATGTALSDRVVTATFSPDGTTLVLGGDFTGKAKVYSVSGTTITYVSDIYADAESTVLSGAAYTATFSPDGTTLVLGGNFTGKAKVYSVSGTTITYVSDIYADAESTVLSGAAYTATFSPGGSTLVLGGFFTGCAKVYSVSGTTIAYVSDIYANATGTPLKTMSGRVYAATFSPDGAVLVLGGGGTRGMAKAYSVSGTTIAYVSDIASVNATNSVVNAATFSPDGTTLVLNGVRSYAKVYSVSGTTITYINVIYTDAEATAPDFFCPAAFSPNGAVLVLGGLFTGFARIYSVSGTTITYVSDIYGVKSTALNGCVSTVAFSPDGSTLVLGGSFTGRATAYSVSGSIITYVSDIYADATGTALSDRVVTATFSPDGTTLVLGGDFTGKAKVYSVSGTTITYVSDIYADAESTVLSGAAYTATFSPDSTTLVLGGDFTGKAKVYSVSGTTITYVSDIYADIAGTALSSSVYTCFVQTATFSPGGSTLVLGGFFTGCAKVYSVSGTTITFVSDIASVNATNSVVSAATFSPDGTTLVLGGFFTGCAKVYSVSGTTITYVSDIYADAESTVLSGAAYTATFSPDSTTLVLGGDFTGKAKVYSVSGTTIAYVSDIYADAESTVLSGAAYTATFSPDGTTLVLGGDLTGYGVSYKSDKNGIYYDTSTIACNVPQMIISVKHAVYGVGISKSDIETGERGAVSLIALIK